MTRIVIDASLAHQLKTSSSRLELCGPTGELVGHFVPAIQSASAIPFTEEEIKRAEQEPGGRPLADILADLEKR